MYCLIISGRHGFVVALFARIPVGRDIAAAVLKYCQPAVFCAGGLPNGVGLGKVAVKCAPFAAVVVPVKAGYGRPANGFAVFHHRRGGRVGGFRWNRFGGIGRK